MEHLGGLPISNQPEPRIPLTIKKLINRGTFIMLVVGVFLHISPANLVPPYTPPPLHTRIFVGKPGASVSRTQRVISPSKRILDVWI